jgi:GntP family gluconate:H+ symporter
MELMGWVVSIPVFCDSGFVILNPIRKALVQRTRESSVSMTIGLASGLYIAHVFIPPTPGPIAAASTLGIGDNLLLVMGLGVVCSIFPLIAGYFYAKFIGKRVKADDEVDNAEVVKTYEELIAEYGKLPSGFSSLAPIIVPIILMALASIFSMAQMTGIFADIVAFLGTPIIALAVGTVFATAQLSGAGKMSEFYNICNETLKTVGPILFVTAAGGVLGKVISASDMVNYISSHAEVLSAMGIFFPFLLSAILKSAQGSSTVALTTTAGIVAPLLSVLGFTTPVQVTLVCMAIGAGAMTVSHANDSYFWVVTNFGAMSPDRGYKTQTMNTLVMGIAAIVEIALLSLILH